MAFYQIANVQEVDLKRNFDMYDRDRSGNISVNELRSIYQAFGTPVTESQLAAIIAKADVNRDGTISYPEFVNLVTGRYPVGYSAATRVVSPVTTSYASYAAPVTTTSYVQPVTTSYIQQPVATASYVQPVTTSYVQPTTTYVQQPVATTAYVQPTTTYATTASYVQPTTSYATTGYVQPTTTYATGLVQPTTYSTGLVQPSTYGTQILPRY